MRITLPKPGMGHLRQQPVSGQTVALPRSGVLTTGDTIHTGPGHFHQERRGPPTPADRTLRAHQSHSLDPHRLTCPTCA
ncbi:hypothetical protein [Streptomyces eurythermus]|uniref:hypothetical protein n=1 Tax=Streptomyces eurythermus TaxID=42237 RepID=UPI0034081C77